MSAVVVDPVALPPGFGSGVIEPADQVSFLAASRHLVKDTLDAVLYDKVPVPRDPTGHERSPTSDSPLAPSSFRLHSMSGGITIKTGVSPVSSIVTVLAVTEIPATPYEIMAHSMTPGNTAMLHAFMTESDPMFRDGHVFTQPVGRGASLDETGVNVPGRLGPVLPLLTEYWVAVTFPWPLWGRDFAVREVVTRVFQNGAGHLRYPETDADAPAEGEREWFVSNATSFEREDMPDLEKSHKFVRAYLGMGSYACAACPDSTPDNPKSTFVYLALADVKGAIGDWVQNLIAPQQGQNPIRIRGNFVSRRKAEALLAPVAPPSIARDPVRGLVPKLITIARGTETRKVVSLPVGASLSVWTAVEAKRVTVTVGVEPAAPFTLTLPGGEAFENGSKLESGVVLAGVVGPVTAATTVTVTWSNTDAHFSSKTVAYQLEYVQPAGDVAPVPAVVVGTTESE